MTPVPLRIGRREMLSAAGIGLLGAPLFQAASHGRLAAAEPKEVNAPKPAIEPLNRFPRMMQEWLVRQVREIEAAGDARRAALKTRADAEAYVLSVRERLRNCFGPAPEKTPLLPRTTGVVERERYRIEKIIFESRPGLQVASNLYLPKNRSGPLPAVVVACGHSENSKSAIAEYSIVQGFVLQGYAVLIYDPTGQGERYQYLNDGIGSRYKYSTFEHAQTCNQQVLVGESGSAWFAWDGIRALDYLLSRPEIDPQRVGITGNSGGGMETAYLCALEPRFTMAAPSGWITTLRRNAENELTQDTEQCLRRVLALGLDQSDMLAAFAPKPIVIQTQEKDFFDIRGSQETFARLKHLYALLGKPNDIHLKTGPHTHSYPKANREVTYRVFNAAAGVTGSSEEPPIMVEQDETLWCTPRGQVLYENSRTVFSFTRERSASLKKTRPKLDDEALRNAARALLKMPEVDGMPDYSILRSAGKNRYSTKNYCTYAVTTEPGIQAIVTRLTAEPHVARPPRGAKRALLYVAHLSADAEMRKEPLFAELLNAEKDAAIYGCDVRGIGESRADIGGPRDRTYAFDADYFYAANGIMLDKPYLGQKTFDVLRVLGWLQDQGHTEIHLAAKGWGALAGVFAALLSPAVVQTTLKNSLRSFAEVAETEDYRWPYHTLLPDVLLHFDLPDCYQALAGKQLKLLEPWGAGDGLG
ncbi:MAG: acetylxylan esterase [Planctomycetia bacterium]|nr:acetylxylan esterase [Planctomycetia bacterium]